MQETKHETRAEQPESHIDSGNEDGNKKSGHEYDLSQESFADKKPDQSQEAAGDSSSDKGGGDDVDLSKESFSGDSKLTQQERDELRQEKQRG